VSVEQLGASDAKVDEKTGKLTWKLDLDAGEKKVLTYKYSVRYPRYLNLSLE